MSNFRTEADGLGRVDVPAEKLWGAQTQRSQHFSIGQDLIPREMIAVLLMLAGLILCGVAFEFRSKAERMRWIWNASFAGGAVVAAFVQGSMVGALVEGLPLSNGRYAGGEFGWFSPFAVLCGIGLCVGYALLGACWLVQKCDEEVRDQAYRLIPYLSAALLVFLIAVFIYALAQDFAVMARWLDRPCLFVFPIVGALAAITLAASVHRRQDELPFPVVAVIFLAAFCTLAISFWPYMIPFSITIQQAAAPHSSLPSCFGARVSSCSRSCCSTP
jgi:cytochrome bd ubiquinol oxidase subunit II